MFLSPPKVKIFVIFCILNTCATSETDSIDKDHLDMFPYCGSMYQGNTKTKARAINSQESEQDYRWAVFILRRYIEPKSGNEFTTLCSGSIITDRYEN